MLLEQTTDTQLSMEKWDDLYSVRQDVEVVEASYKELFLDDTYRQLLEHSPKELAKEGVYLEIGCGPGYLGEELAKQGWFFMGIDFSLEALRHLRRRLDQRGINNYLLIHADIQQLPLRDQSVDLIYGGGVIEHFKNTQVVINHLYRVLAACGKSFNTVPYLNIANLFYRSLWGGIPNYPLLKQLAEFVHIRLLQGRHMIFGYELQFTMGQLHSLHTKAGFRTDDIVIDRFDVELLLERVPFAPIRHMVQKLSVSNRQFWPMLKVVGTRR